MLHTLAYSYSSMMLREVAGYESLACAVPMTCNGMHETVSCNITYEKLHAALVAKLV